MNQKTRIFEKLSLIFICLLLLICFAKTFLRKTAFDGQRAFSLLVRLQGSGARVPSTESHSQAVGFITHQLIKNGWIVQQLPGIVEGHPCINILATRGNGQPKILLASHYDSRMHADRDPDPDRRYLPVPGANDGGSSTVVLLELSRVLTDAQSSNIGLLFFDIEDQGDIPGWDWILGSREFSRQESYHPELLILLDMVGGYNQTIQPPSNSDQFIYQQIQSTADQFEYDDHFLNPSTYSIIDDHVPFLEAGVPSVDLIDIIDPNWHTIFDDIENVSVTSLQRVGDTLYAYLIVIS
ncbi:MAG: M28 family peptidase [Leptolinea sp.]|jgi:hypothetical protein|nr:M28 family peptidase [Leptolinea sp.]